MKVLVKLSCCEKRHLGASLTVSSFDAEQARKNTVALFYGDRFAGRATVFVRKNAVLKIIPPNRLVWRQNIGATVLGKNTHSDAPKRSKPLAWDMDDLKCWCEQMHFVDIGWGTEFVAKALIHAI